ncbi:1-(5-phosphoribosyl)-5-[(5-phosphoribosylamino)methylideneamino] imidazole-4-carboxamide isomerase [Chlorella vulgaris]
MQQATGNQLLSAAPSAAKAPRSRTHVVVNARAVQFRPCIDIHQGKVKQIVGSTLQDLQGGGEQALQTNFESEQPSSWYADLYKRDALTGGHVIMLGADDASKAAATAALAAYPGGLQLGGGVTVDNAKQYLDAGASHVIVTSYVFREGRLEHERLAALVDLVGSQRLVLDLSCRKKEDGLYYVVTDRWQKFSDLALSEASLAQLAQSCDEFLVHGVDVEGMQLGIDDELVGLLGDWSPIPVTYAGGARTLDDLERVRLAGKGRVDITVGSALDIFGGQLPYTDVVAWHQQQQQAGREAAATESSSSGGSDGSSEGGGSGGSSGPAELGERRADGTVMYRF